MHSMILIAVIFSIFIISLDISGATAVFICFLCLSCFIWGTVVYREIMIDHIKSGEPVKFGEAFYQLKPVDWNKSNKE